MELRPRICHQRQVGVGFIQPAQQPDEMACMQSVLSARTDGLMLANGLAFETIANQSAQIAANNLFSLDVEDE